ncbi:membrane proteins related to metalloendopeptidases [Longilinea arvoryzae]|uniref:Membrane proteins related to metalloendopeptidases n=1 Tax=Longilinea arvoryzae TaxID=360412 RepID=A0A0S7BJ61_9CHLR|nr:peptidoglycan DD-metalloendopeptidase family protein [Longilinea arvoryzae]GAP14392.1 membrane proteins related to metalloendopeptidases [Longilinea arvoryzae]
MKTRLVLFLLAACLILAGCQPASIQAETTEIPLPSSTPQPELPDLQATPETPGLHVQETPLHFTFPTPGNQPVSLWRPPLYEVPWALGEHDHFFFSRPIAADEINWPLADYRYGGIFPDSDIVHTGIDIDAPYGTPILAAAPGKVVWTGYGLYTGAGNEGDPYGQAVVIRHDFGYQGRQLYTVYAHMSAVKAYLGQRVETGTVIGEVGDTGFTTGPHLHFEVRIETNSFFATRNPELWLAPPQGWGVLTGRLMDRRGMLLTKQEVVVYSIDTGQTWSVLTYGPTSANQDDYYQENMVLSDLPAGDYYVYVSVNGTRYRTQLSINPGAVTYFSFHSTLGFDLDLPATPSPDEWLTPES